jgi:hypothetical protein
MAKDPMKKTDMEIAQNAANAMSGYSGPSTAKQQQEMAGKYGTAPEGKELYTIKGGKAVYKTKEEIAALDKNIPDYSNPNDRAEINYQQREATRQEITPQQQAQSDARFLQTLKGLKGMPDRTSVFNGVDYAPAATAARAAARAERSGGAQPTVTQPTVTQPSTTQPSVTQPTVTQPTVTQPSTTQPSVTQPTVTQPSTTQPTVTQPSTTQPTITSSKEPVTTPKNDNPLPGILNPSGDVSDMGNEKQNLSFNEIEYLQGMLKKQKNKGITPFGGSFVPPTAMA